MAANIETSNLEEKVEGIVVESEDADKEAADNALKSDESGVEKPGPFGQKTWMEDLTLTVEGKNLYVSKVAMALISPVFRKMFEEDFPTQNEIVLPGKRYAEFLEFLLCVYPNSKTSHKIDKNNIMTVAPLITEYKVENMVETCSDVLSSIVDSLNSPKELLHYFRISLENGFEGPKRRCASLLAQRNIGELEKTQQFSELPLKQKNELLTALLEEQTKTNDRQRKIINDHEATIKGLELIKSYLLNQVRRAEIWGLETAQNCYFIEHEFCAYFGNVSFSDYTNCGPTKVAFGVSKDKNYLNTWLKLEPKRAEDYGAPKMVTFIIVNNFSPRKNIWLEQTSNFTSDRKWRDVQWKDLMDESKCFVKDGKVKICALVIM